MNWNDLKTILAIHRKRTIPAASEDLNVNETTVRRCLQRLEKAMGVSLFERTVSGLIPTQAGSQVIETAEKIELETQRLMLSLSGKDQLAAGKVRLTAVPLVMNQILIPALAGFIRNYPEIELELIAVGDDLSLTNREADIALRMARPVKELRAIARKIGMLDYAKFYRSDLPVNDLKWIGYEKSMNQLPQAHWISKQQGLSSVEVSDGESLLVAVQSGIGKGLLPIKIAEQFEALQAIDDEIPLSRELWVMIHPDLQPLARIRVVVDWLISEFKP